MANVPAPNHVEVLSRLAIEFVAVVPEIASLFREARDLKLKGWSKFGKKELIAFIRSQPGPASD